MQGPARTWKADLRAFYETSVKYEAALSRAPKENFADYVEMMCRVSSCGDLVLDGACGVGQSVELLAESGRRPVGVDISRRFLAAAACRCQSLATADVAQLPFADGTFDAVGIYQALEHLPDIASAMRELLRVTRPGGTVVTYLLNYFSITRPRWRAAIAKKRGARAPRWLIALREMLRSVWVPLGKMCGHDREPHLVEPLLGEDWLDADYDAVSALHPLDVLHIVRAEGCSARLCPSPRDSWHRRAARRILWHFGPGWWAIIRKPTADDRGRPPA